MPQVPAIIETPSLPASPVDEVRARQERLMRLALESMSLNTRRTYASALRSLERWLGSRPLDDMAFAEYVEARHSVGLSPSALNTAAAAVRWRARFAGLPSPIGPISERILAGARREGYSRGRGQAVGISLPELRAILEAAPERRRYADGRRESERRAAARGKSDAAMASLLFMGAMRVSEVVALTWADIEPGPDQDTLLVRVRKSKTNQVGTRADVRYVKDFAARAIMRLAGPERPDPAVRLFPLSVRQAMRRFGDACVAAGIGWRSAHAGRVGLATTLTRLGATPTEVMLAGGWTDGNMVTRYAASATAERGAVAKYL